MSPTTTIGSVDSGQFSQCNRKPRKLSWRCRMCRGNRGRMIRPMRALLGQVVFAAGENSYSWADVVLAARLRGDWDELEEVVRQGLVCVRHARATRELPRRSEVEEAASAF